MTPVYTSKLGPEIWITIVGAQKFDGSLLMTFKMVIVNFQMEDKLARVQFF